MKKIAITFAGRKDRMANQVRYMNEFLEEGVIDEWHLWNFSRNAHDNNWLISSFSKKQRMLYIGFCSQLSRNRQHRHNRVSNLRKSS